MSGDDVIPAVVSIPEAARGLELPLEPRDLVTVNDAIVRIAAIERRRKLLSRQPVS